MLLDAWRLTELEAMENNEGGDVSIVESKLPRKLKMKRMAKDEEGNELGWEEYYDYQFPDDEKKISKFINIINIFNIFLFLLLLFNYHYYFNINSGIKDIRKCYEMETNDGWIIINESIRAFRRAI